MIEFFYPPSDFQKELLKLIVQFAGALFIAWLTVRWAIRRFKTEKLWERETTTIADVLTALRELEEINYLRMKDYGDETPHTPQFLKELHQRHEAAKRKLIAVSATASLVLPATVQKALTDYETEILRSYENDEPWIDYLTREADRLVQARVAILKAARSHVRNR